MKKIIVAIIAFFLTFSLASCFSSVESYDVFVTVYPMEFVTQELLKGTEYTVGIVPGVTSHESSVDWSPKEIIAMTEATYLFYVGANYDQYIDLQIDSIFQDKSVELVKVEDQKNYIEFIPGLVHYFDENNKEVTVDDNLGLDPHFWMSPKKMQQVSALIHDKLSEKFTDVREIMQKNYDDLTSKLQKLSDAFDEVISKQQKPIMTATNIYGYLREDYGLDFFSISPGYHEETEQFTSQQKDAIVTEALNNSIEYIIYQKNTVSPLSNAVYTELAKHYTVEKLQYDILQALTDEEISNGNDYITVMYDNLELLKLAVDYQSN